MAINKKSITQEEFFHADPSPGDIGTSWHANAPYYAPPYLLLATFQKTMGELRFRGKM